MAFTLSSPPFNLPTSYSSSTSIVNTRRRVSFTRSFVAKAGENEGDETAAPSFNPFGFVTDNPSSRSAIQLPESPAETECWPDALCSSDARFGPRGTVVFLHGAPTQSYSYRCLFLSQMADAGFHCYTPDWLGFDFSEKPQAGFDGFDYSEKEYHEQLDKLLDVLEIKLPFILVVQGFLVGSFGLTWALKNPDRISKLVIMNTPLIASSPIPGLFQQLRIPLLGEFTCQNAIMAERFIEAGSAYESNGSYIIMVFHERMGLILPCYTYVYFYTSYVLKVEKADVYRLPYLKSSGPGFALLEATKKANFRGISGQIADCFASRRWDKLILVAWGISDKYLPQSIAEEFQKGNPSAVTLKLIEGAGHMPQEDWPEKVFDALRYFL